MTDDEPPLGGEERGKNPSRWWNKTKRGEGVHVGDDGGSSRYVRGSRRVDSHPALTCVTDRFVNIDKSYLLQSPDKQTNLSNVSLHRGLPGTNTGSASTDDAFCGSAWKRFERSVFPSERIDCTQSHKIQRTQPMVA